MTYQDLFSHKTKFRMSSADVVTGTLRVKCFFKCLPGTSCKEDNSKEFPHHLFKGK